MRKAFSFLVSLLLLFSFEPRFSRCFGMAEDQRSSVSSLPDLSQMDPLLKKHLDFWIRIYTHFNAHQGLIHDAKYIDHIYEIVDLREGGITSVRAKKRKWKAILLSLHRKESTLEPLTDEEKRVFNLFQDVNEPNKFLNAAHRKRLRFQLGQKDQFLEGLYQSGRYLASMERIFRDEGLPVELTRLPFVESSFNIRARSKVGASGIWQFMRSTGRLFLMINDAVDERNDPIRATEAAGKLLKLNFGSLQSWPLAVTAYNHGRKSLMRTVRRVGSSQLENLISESHSRSFGFASSNFFTELLAAITVERNPEKYFDHVKRMKELEFVEAEIPDFLEFHELKRTLGVDAFKLKELNPALSEGVFSGELLIPPGYRFRVPVVAALGQDRTLKRFWAAYSKIPPFAKRKGQREGKYDRTDQ